MSSGIKDKVVILGAGCSKFGERWDCGAEDLLVEATEECLQDAGIEKKQIEAIWQGTGIDAFNVGPGSLSTSLTLHFPYVPVTKVENFCASATEALRGAAYAVASGACKIALAVGVEKLKDVGYGGLPQRTRGVFNDIYYPNISAPGLFGQLATGYAAVHGISMADLKRAMAHVSVKSHANGLKNEKAHLRKAITEEQVLNAPMIAEPIGLYDCCGVSDGAACAIVTTPEIARSLGKKNLVSIKSLQLSTSNGEEAAFSNWDGSFIKPTRVAAAKAYEEAGIKNPKKEISMTEVHDCFSITELVTMEDIFLSERGQAVKDVMNGVFDADGEIPCQIDGGLKCFGHPIGASGLRMIYEMYLQLQGRAGERQLKDPKIGLVHNLGGYTHMNVASVAIIGKYGV